MIRYLIAFAIVITLFISLAAYLSLRPPYADRIRFVSFSVSSAESFFSVAQRLANENLIRSQRAFYYTGRLTGKSGSLKAGEYELNNKMTAYEMLKVVTGGRVKLHRITIPEGQTMFQVATALEDAGLVDKLQFLEAAWDQAFVDSLGIPSFTVEGYLFPETYFIPRGSSARTIIRMFVDMFWTKVNDSLVERAHSAKFSVHQALIMASVIQKESGLVAEMPIISSVFHNRLATGMKIQSDPTAVYDILPYGGLVTREHLFRNTPFNTYRIKSLPLTPISNPGFAAIEAALFPKTTRFFYFVSRRDGSHHFSESYDEHKQAIDKFLK